jgi:branched-chain amino acid transport system ATP-binding protein/urea transport system ATP-binding protein
LVCIEQTIEIFPRLKPILHRTGGVLSGGEQQILALARCLVGGPQLVLLDEPTEGIQPSIVDEIAETVSALAQRGQTSFLIVEQDIEFLSQLCFRIDVLSRGRIAGEFAVGASDSDQIAALLDISG